MRRGQPCLHRIHGIPISVNVGDGLFSKAFEVLSANRDLLGPEKALKLLAEVVAGAQETIEGQAYDIGWAKEGTIPTVEEFMPMLRKKTGWYSGRGPCAAGAIIAGAAPGGRREAERFGEAIAVAFQLRDDLLNIQVEDKDARAAPGARTGGYGKERGGDIAEGKRTLMVIDLLSACSAVEREKVLAILDRDRTLNTPEEIEWVISLMAQYGSLARVQTICEQTVCQGIEHLDRLPDSEAKETLREMAAFLVQREF